MLKVLSLLLGLMLAVTAAQAKIGWTYKECVAHWGQETDRLILNKQVGETWIEVPIFMFHRGKRYVAVDFSVIGGLFSYEKSKVIAEAPSNESGF
jgi:hypothetical protein